MELRVASGSYLLHQAFLSRFGSAAIERSSPI
jgi:hypothetical protein